MAEEKDMTWGEIAKSFSIYMLMRIALMVGFIGIYYPSVKTCFIYYNHKELLFNINSVHLIVFIIFAFYRNIAFWNQLVLREITGIMPWAVIMLAFLFSYLQKNIHNTINHNLIAGISLLTIEVGFMYFQWRKKHGI